jgi:nucleoside-diphosphate-sugar epimerase
MTVYSSERNDTHTVLGATGAYGYSLTKLLIRKKYNVKLAVRDVEKARVMFGDSVDIDNVNIFDRDSVINSIKGSGYIYVAFNFPYNKWNNYFLAISNLIEGAKLNHSNVIFPGNVYGYGKFQKIPVTESHPLLAETKKGKIRNQIEILLRESFERGDIGLLIPKFSNFYGPNVTNDLFGAMFQNALKNKPVRWILNADVPHTFTFIEDAARATMYLVDHNKFDGEVYHISSGEISARNFISKIFRELGYNCRIRLLTKRQIIFMSLFSSQVREVQELEYEFEEPYIISDRKFREKFPQFSYTPYDEGIKVTLNWFRTWFLDGTK